MPNNWYQKIKRDNKATSRYYGSLSANIVVPEIEDKEQEREFAYNVLNEALPSNSFVGESNVNFNIEGVEPYG